jgi:ketosteroid isomerase-like protein
VSQENVEIIKRGYEAWNRGDMAVVLEGCDPNVEWRDRGDWLDVKVRRGHDGFREGWAEIAEAFSEFRMEPKEFIDAGDYVVVPIHRVGTGRASGALIEEDEVHVYRMRAGKAVELREYHEKKEALEAVGPCSSGWRDVG